MNKGTKLEIISKIPAKKTRSRENKAVKIYKRLLKEYGLQGWWPLINPKTGRMEYFKNGRKKPLTSGERFQICQGAILTQNISFGY